MDGKVEQNKNIYIVLSCNDTFIGKVIRNRGKLKFWNRYAGDCYSHVSISLEPTLNNMMSFARKKITNPFISGLVREDIDRGIFERSGRKSKIAVLQIEVLTEQYEDIYRILEECWEKRDEYKYNFLSLFCLLLCCKGVPIHNKYVCSHWVAEIMEECMGYRFKKKRACDVRPLDFYDAFRENIVYEGLTMNYSKYLTQRK